MYLSVLASQLGDRVGIGDLDDTEVRANLDLLREQGIANVRISSLSTADLALSVIPGAPGGPPAGPSFQAVVFCSDSVRDRTPAETVLHLRNGADLFSTQIVFVSGSACANLAVGLDVSRGLIAAGVADSVLLLTADTLLSGTRFPPISSTVFSDGAASCLVTARPVASSFRLLGTATENWPAIDDDGGELAAPRKLLTATRSAAGRATGGSLDGFHHLVTPNFGDSTRRLLAMAVPSSSLRPHPGVVSEVGHCFAADVLLNLHDLEHRRLINDGDKVLTIAASRQSLSVMTFQYCENGGE